MTARSLTHENSIAKRVSCDECGRRTANVRLRTRIDECLREQTRRLCRDCGERLGHTVVAGMKG